MAEENRPADAALDASAGLLDTPRRWGFLAAVRALNHDTVDRGGAPVGRATHIDEDRVRFRQDPGFGFRPREVEGAEAQDDDGRGPLVELSQNVIGFFGPNGALPDHVTDEARARGPRGTPRGRGMLAEFCNMLQHRLTGLLYRSWARGALVTSRDRGADSTFPRFVDATFGAAAGAMQEPGEMSPSTRRFMAGRFAARAGSADDLGAVIGILTGAPVDVSQFDGEWIALPPSERSRLGQARLGSASLGSMGYSASGAVSARIGPLDLATYRALLPGGALHAEVGEAARHVLGLTTRLRLVPVLSRDAMPAPVAGGGMRLGWDSWLPPAATAPARDGDDLRLTIGLHRAGAPDR